MAETIMPVEAVRMARARPGRWIGMGWDVVKGDIGVFALITLVAIALSLVGSFVVTGPLTAGMFVAVRRRIVSGRADLADLFSGFILFIDSFLIHILVSVFCLIGLALLFFPVFIVAALYLFPYLFLIDHKAGFWDAMEMSRKLVLQDLVGYVWFVVLLTLLNLLGLIMLGIGLLVTIPVSAAAIAIAYKEIVGFEFSEPQPSGPVVIP